MKEGDGEEDEDGKRWDMMHTRMQRGRLGRWRDGAGEVEEGVVNDMRSRQGRSRVTRRQYVSSVGVCGCELRGQHAFPDC